MARSFEKVEATINLSLEPLRSVRGCGRVLSPLLPGPESLEEGPAGSRDHLTGSFSLRTTPLAISKVGGNSQRPGRSRAHACAHGSQLEKARRINTVSNKKTGNNGRRRKAPAQNSTKTGPATSTT